MKKALYLGLFLFITSIFYFGSEPSIRKIKQQVSYVSSLKSSDIFLIDVNNQVSLTKVKVSEINVPAIINFITEGNMDIPTGFRAVLPSDCKLLSHTLENGLLKLNFNKNLFTGNVNDTQVIEAIVYNMTALSDVKDIIIFQDNIVVTKLPKSGMNLPPLLNRSFGINHEYDIHTFKNTNSVTVYQLKVYNDNFYYTPVTKVTNNDDQKIFKIINELNQTALYSSNLLTFIDNNVKLLNTLETKEELVLEFSPELLALEQYLLDQVIYTLTFAVDDNYEAENLTIKVENKEIYKKNLQKPSI